MFSEYTKDQIDVIKSNRICKVYSSSYNANYWYPYKLTPVGKSWTALNQSCWSMIIDSNKSDDSITNERIIQECVDRQPEYVIPKDYVGQADRTLESIIEFKELLQDNPDIDSKAVPIVQFDKETGKTHAEHVKTNKSFYISHSKLAIGGLHEFTPAEQIHAIKKVRSVLGYDINLHAFGVGADMKHILAFRTNPKLIDSFDMSSAEQMPINNSVPEGGLSLKQTTPSIYIPSGKNISTVNAQYAKANLLKINYLLSDHLNEDKFVQEIEKRFTDKQIVGIIKATTPKPENIDWEQLPFDLSDPEEKKLYTESTLGSFSSG